MTILKCALKINKDVTLFADTRDELFEMLKQKGYSNYIKPVFNLDNIVPETEIGKFPYWELHGEFGEVITVYIEECIKSKLELAIVSLKQDRDKLYSDQITAKKLDFKFEVDKIQIEIDLTRKMIDLLKSL